MKIEKISDTQIRCTLTGKDLADRHIQVSELAYGSDKAKSLFRDMMQQASYEFGFDAEDIPLMIEAIPVNKDHVILNITKVEYPDELDTRFSNFSNEDYEANLENFDTTDGNAVFSEGADHILDLFQQIQKAASPRKDTHSSKKESPFIPLKDTAADITPTAGKEVPPAPVDVASDLIKLFSFQNLDDIMHLAYVLKDFYMGENTLYQDPQQHRYYLLVHKSEHSPSEFNKVCNILAEYAIQSRYYDSAAAFFGEHFRLITRKNALQQLAKVAHN